MSTANMKCPQCGNEKKNYIQEGLNRCGVCSITWPIEQAKTEIPRCISCKRCAALRVYNLEFCSDFCRRDYEEKQAATPQDNPTLGDIVNSNGEPVRLYGDSAGRSGEIIKSVDGKLQWVAPATSGSYSVKITSVRQSTEPRVEIPENRLIPLTILKGREEVYVPEGLFYMEVLCGIPRWAGCCKPGYSFMPGSSSVMPLIVYSRETGLPVRLLLWNETLVQEEAKSAPLQQVEDPDCHSGAFMVNSELLEKLAARIEEDTREAAIGVNLYEFGKCRDCGSNFAGIGACRCEGQPDYTKQLREKLEK